MYVVAGATGQTGGAVADNLLRHGKKITVLARSAEKGAEWSRKGAKVAVAELEDADALTKALTGVEGAYLLVPPSYDVNDYVQDRANLAGSMAKAVAASGIPHVVLLSSEGAQLDSGTGPIVTNHNAEEALKAAVKNLTIVRAAYFLENWDSVLGAAKDGGVLPTFLTPDRRIAMVASRDIGRVAAESLLDPARGRRTIELAGPEDYSPEDIAHSLSKVFGRKIEVQAAPMSAAPAVLQSDGMSEDLARLFVEMLEGINSGRIDFERTGAEFKRGVVTPVDVFARAAK
jgi:uncharacterized protein YbjT (DUF2867 family)